MRQSKHRKLTCLLFLAVGLHTPCAHLVNHGKLKQRVLQNSNSTVKWITAQCRTSVITQVLLRYTECKVVVVPPPCDPLGDMLVDKELVGMGPFSHVSSTTGQVKLIILADTVIMSTNIFAQSKSHQDVLIQSGHSSHVLGIPH